MTFRLATPAEQARMSWHARQRYQARRRAYARALEAERPKPHHAGNPAPSMDCSAIHAIAALLTPVLEEAWTASDRRGARARKHRPETTAQAKARKESTRRIHEANAQQWVEKRHKALGLLDKGMPVASVAWVIGVAPRTIRRWRRAAESERTAAA